MKTVKASHRTSIVTSIVFILAGTVNAAECSQENPEVSVILISVVCIALLIYLYRLHVMNTKLKRELGLYKAKFADYLRSTEGKYEPIKTNQTARAVKSEEKNSESTAGLREQHTKRLYWDRLMSTVDQSTTGKSELEGLEAKKKDLEEMIRITKKKYHQREIDEKGFSELIKEQQKQMIEIEARINKLRG